MARPQSSSLPPSLRTGPRGSRGCLTRPKPQHLASTPLHAQGWAKAHVPPAVTSQINSRLASRQSDPWSRFCGLMTLTASHLPFCPQVHTEQLGICSVHRFVHDCCSSPPTPPASPSSFQSTQSLHKGQTLLICEGTSQVPLSLIGLLPVTFPCPL